MIKALAVNFKNLTDNIFTLTPEFCKNHDLINFNLKNIIKEILGYEIDNKTKFFIEKFKKLAEFN